MLLRTLILRPLRRDLLRTTLTILSVALGVAVIVAIDLAGDAATGSFHSSMESLAGRTDLQILANGGIDERYIGVLSALPYDAHFAPVIEAQETLPGIGSVPLYGVDLAGSPDLLASQSLAARLHFPPARTVNVPGEFLLLDIAAAQQRFHRFGKLDRIDVTVGRDENFANVERAIRAALPPAYLVGKPGLRGEENQRMLRAFRWNLRVLSYISLVVGAFLIYNTISVSVVRRRAEIGILRAIGAGRFTVFALFLGEALIFGLAGAAIGLALGRLLASATVQLIAGTINALFTTSRPAPVELTAGESWLAFATGTAVALLSAFAPAREAMCVTPAEAMSRGAHQHRSRLHWRRVLAWSVLFAAAAYGAACLAPIAGFPVGGYASALLAVAAAALAAPAVVLLVNRATRSLAARRVESLLAGRGLAAALSRTSVVVAALATAIAMMASVGIMVGSFRETVTVWLDAQLRADLYVGLTGAAGLGHALPAGLPARLQSIPGVAALDLYEAAALHFRGERATLAAGNLDIVRRFGRLRFLPGENRDAILRSLPGRDRAIASEPFANRFGVRPGQRLVVPIGSRNVTLTIAGIYYDYSSSQGFLVMDRSALGRYLPGLQPSNAAVYLSPGADLEAVRREMQLRTAGMGVTIASNRDLRRVSLTVFDRTFAITWALEAVAIVVAMLGAANALLALVLDRRREFGLLRYLGASPRQVQGLILAESAFLGLLAALIGLALGFALSLVLIFVVNKQSFGWTIQFHPPAALLAGAILLIWCVTTLAGLYPARVASRLNPIDVIHEE